MMKFLVVRCFFFSSDVKKRTFSVSISLSAALSDFFLSFFNFFHFFDFFYISSFFTKKNLMFGKH